MEPYGTAIQLYVAAAALPALLLALWLQRYLDERRKKKTRDKYRDIDYKDLQ